MRRLLRHAFTLCSAISLVLCVAVCVLWVRSYWLADRWEGYEENPRALTEREWTLRSSRGTLGLLHMVWRFETREGYAYAARYPAETPPPLRYVVDKPVSRDVYSDDHRYLRALGFFYYANSETKQTPGNRGSFTFRDTWIEVPYWFLALVLSAPLLHKVKIRLRRARQPGMCAQCGYDLRAHAEGERCPECGSVA